MTSTALRSVDHLFHRSFTPELPSRLPVAGQIGRLCEILAQAFVDTRFLCADNFPVIYCFEMLKPLDV
jgi:hypothetical protein